MKSVSTIRNLDNLGRITIPKELRESRDINLKDILEIFIDDNKIILRKYQLKCCLCDSPDNTIKFKEKLICRDCIDNLCKRWI